jgi:hypothetical protein
MGHKQRDHGRYGDRADQGNRLRVTRCGEDGTIRLRESDEPGTVLATTPEGLAALLEHLRPRPNS